MSNLIEQQLEQLKAQVLPHMPGYGGIETPIPELFLYRTDVTTEVTPVVYEPSLCLMLQGEKEVYLNNERIVYDPLSYLLVPVTVPVSGKVTKASIDKPYLAIRMTIDLKELADLVIDLGGRVERSRAQVKAMSVGRVDESLLSAFSRLMQLLDKPADIPVLYPLLKREILYRLLLGDSGSQLRDFMLLDSQGHRISKVIEILRKKYNEPLRIKDLADEVHLSESALFQAFKAVTAMSPLQYQKKLRLNEARRIMLYEGVEAATASYKVGYESPSQFSREYSRLFGAPPKADIERVRLQGG
ncbi:DNA-binding domain-containing protein, AraC-type [Rheinheimera sp. A13L]|uniref:AraC family transcriptional regulator n=1 Tax=Rheinheimera sp. A13L TaxID=506534 RepID=UPI0002124856|nr:AraC family transcriptional regulator [Rheinheimera sp. A13L]EGM78972.1 DNA-binding domain-containing protein, AraC-type [Rheinheimera sp. A13L]